jgi:hypothetical protein
MNPTEEYGKRLAQRKAHRNECSTRMNTIGYLRLGLAVAFLGMLWLALAAHVVSVWFSAIPAVLFIGFAFYHERLRLAHARAIRSVKFYERGLDRLEDRWQGKGNAGSEHLPEGHLYAIDLDILGRASLFELLSTARTRAGEEILARWLCAPATRAEILKRQEAVHELRNNIDLREDLALIGPEIRMEYHVGFMSQWAKSPIELDSAAARIAAATLVVLLPLTFVVSSVLLLGPLPVLVVVALQVALAAFYRDRVREVLDTIDAAARELRILGDALQRIEREKYASSRLRELQDNLSRGRRLPSKEIAVFQKLVGYLNQRRNEFFFLFSLPLMWATQFAFAIEAWRKRCGPEIDSWLANFGEFEALSDLAAYAFEHPEEPFPEIVEGKAVLEAESLRHPLIPASECVPNSVQLAGELQLLLISGSNMSGKSTLLRTIGINAVLAQAGAPVRATRMRLSVMAIGATMRVQDDLQAGVSRFYAEIQRLHDIMELTSGPLPVLFLLDEILHGTNSHDRAIGAEAIIRGLLERRAIGLVTTHDLALTRVAESMVPRAKNVHFQDQLENGRMSFDYILHQGVVEKSNALELMRAVGLKV